MKEIKAIIQPHRLERVLEALHQIESFPGATTSEALGVGAHASTDYERHPRVKLEVVVADDLVARVVDAILRSAHTGNPGDGYLFVVPVQTVVKIRTGERMRSESGGD